MFAGPGRRAVAALIDVFIAAALALAIFAVHVPADVLSPLPFEVHLFLPLAVPLLYFIVFPATRMQATPGKRACGIRIATVGGDRIGLIRSLVRFAASLVSIAIAFAGYLLMVWNRKHRALHDFVAGTVVVDRRARPPEIAWTEPRRGSWLARLAGTAAYAVVIALLVLLYRGPLQGELANLDARLHAPGASR